jgi:hypothetical protein
MPTRFTLSPAMFLPSSELKCPNCSLQLPAEATRSYRPFSCPSCHSLIEARPYFVLGRFGCLTICVIYLFCLFLFGVRWFRMATLALAGGVVAIAIGLNLANRLARRPVLVLYRVRTYPENLFSLAEFLEELSAAPEWKQEFDGDLAVASGRKTSDDELENVAIELAGLYRDALIGTPSHRRRRVKQSFGLDGLRIELQAVARDLRTAHGQCRA